MSNTCLACFKCMPRVVAIGCMGAHHACRPWLAGLTQAQLISLIVICFFNANMFGTCIPIICNHSCSYIHYVGQALMIYMCACKHAWFVSPEIQTMNQHLPARDNTVASHGRSQHVLGDVHCHPQLLATSVCWGLGPKHGEFLVCISKDTSHWGKSYGALNKASQGYPLNPSTFPYVCTYDN
jgi:hypothetical protein